MYDELRRARMEKGLSQQQMAALLGLKTRNAYALKEKGDRKFDVGEALALAEHLNSSVELLFSSGRVNNMVTNEEV